MMPTCNVTLQLLLMFMNKIYKSVVLHFEAMTITRIILANASECFVPTDILNLLVFSFCSIGLPIQQNKLTEALATRAIGLIEQQDSSGRIQQRFQIG